MNRASEAVEERGGPKVSRWDTQVTLARSPQDARDREVEAPRRQGHRAAESRDVREGPESSGC